MSLFLSPKFASRKSLDLLTFRLGSSVSLLCTPLLKRPDVFNLSARRDVHSTQTKSHLTFLLNNNDITPFQKFTVKVLKEQCKSRGLKLSGRKSELLQRLITYDSSSYIKRNAKIAKVPRRSPMTDKPTKANEISIGDKIPKTIDRKHFSMQKKSSIQFPCKDHPYLQPRDKFFLLGFVMLSCLWWNLELQESKPTIDPKQ
ncbi:Aim34p SKDI_13G1380 [Saccharomyces kudriavzevii IFO 1802]|uniref:AIM34-like protein n=2 Tax=Saccharomyces kudriavzevii (strain ATCC MYA-4449 / AS 2.2408 / CBS 8840 / NBRC 1802 / NCYC 2889) TaxID=226230 RepID=J6EIY3_SACK1|nr:uncharacterized protein SKDI_13G1380 [Saccharomyces kudriavzevii IFO 1802]EJT43849.1 AIM34-like protein [Saccharomyces kudriavzevii IFO 1802]CAI4047910.1 hypothetical protein SKDI_13G1380 [Saccharomyces kudriavzevii IFO 1802]